MDEYTRVPVGGPAPYQVVIGRDLPGALPPLLDGAARAALLFAPPLAGYADRLADLLSAAGIAAHPLPVPDAEAAKRIEVAAGCWDALAGAGFTRTDAVVGLGGGAVTDLAGFVAASWLRGVRWVAMPTSLLGMVDAAVGGKTGVNLAAGKNLVGAFHPPAGVLADLATLATLPPAELVAGLAEVVKCGFIADPAILKLIEDDPAGARAPGGRGLAELVERAVRVKAQVVASDLREAGPREFLNYGHTLAHAVEQVTGFRVRHGEAVAVGLVYAAALARLAGRLDRPTADRHRAVLGALGLTTTCPAGDWPALRQAMRVDKKARGSRLRFVVLDGPARPAILDDPPEALLAEAFAEIAAAGPAAVGDPDHGAAGGTA